jgi:hypothetical protein
MNIKERVVSLVEQYKHGYPQPITSLFISHVVDELGRLWRIESEHVALQDGLVKYQNMTMEIHTILHDFQPDVDECNGAHFGVVPKRVQEMEDPFEKALEAAKGK